MVELLASAVVLLVGVAVGAVIYAAEERVRRLTEFGKDTRDRLLDAEQLLRECKASLHDVQEHMNALDRDCARFADKLGVPRD